MLLTIAHLSMISVDWEISDTVVFHIVNIFTMLPSEDWSLFSQMTSLAFFLFLVLVILEDVGF